MATHRVPSPDRGWIPGNEPAAPAPVQVPPSCAAPLHRMAAPAVACVSSGSLLAGGNEVLIEHRGAYYRLKQTSLGKLILTK